jgi:Spy/CpxP family protein refolding chaperone
MRKFSILAALAVSLAGAQAVHAQAPRDSAAHRWNGRGGRGGPGGPGMMEHALFKNITLTDAQKARLAEVQKAERSSMTADSGARRAQFDAMRKARQSGDTATANRLMLEQRTKMEQQFATHTAAVRAILTPDQQKQFDANVAEMKAHRGQFGREHGQKHTKPAPTS